MSTTATITPLGMPLIAGRTRAYFAPVNRATGTPTIFDPAVNSTWNPSAPPSPWMDLGWISGFVRNAESKIAEVDTGMPATTRFQARQSLGATVAFHFATWSKLSMALSAGSDHMNVLAPASNGLAIGSGAKAAPALSVLAASDATTLYVTGAPAAWRAGSVLVVDQDYAGQTGFVGSPVTAGYVQSAGSVGNDPDVIRRLSFNVARVTSVGSDGGFRLANPLPGGAPGATMKAQQVYGFVDREGGSFFQEWSALFLLQGVQGDRLFLHYPRLQTCQSSAESLVTLANALNVVELAAKFRALPVVDGNDGQQVLCYRSYFPAAATYV